MTIDGQVAPEFDVRPGCVQFSPVSVSSLSGSRSAEILVWIFCTSMVGS